MASRNKIIKRERNVCKMKNKKSLDYISILKIIACFLVIVNHTNSEIFFQATTNCTWTISMLTFYACKMAVPIFILISGALMLNKDYDYKKVTKKIVKYSLVLIVISLVYYFDYYYHNATQMGIKNFIIYLNNNNISVHLWYLYFYIALILMMPFLQKIVKNMSNKDFKVFFFISIIINGGVFILIPHYYPQIANNISNYLYLFHPYIALLFSGYFIQNRLEIKNKKLIKWLCFIILILAPIISTFLTYIEKLNDASNYLFYDNVSLINITIPSIAMFLLIKLIINIKSEKKLKIINKIGNCTFTTYLIHMLVINHTIFIYRMLQKYLPLQISMYMWEISVFIISIIISLLINWIIKFLSKNIKNRNKKELKLI